MARSVRGFTIVELLVVISIIGILASILLPAIQSAKERAVKTDCASKLRQFWLAAGIYTNEFDGWLVGALAIDRYGYMDRQTVRDVSTGLLWSYYEQKRIVVCPRDRREERYQGWSYVLNCSTQFRVGLGVDYAYVQHGRHGSWIERPEEVIYFVEENADPGYAGPRGTCHVIDDFYFGAYDYVGARHAGRNVTCYVDGHTGDLGPGLDFPCDEFQKGSQYWVW